MYAIDKPIGSKFKNKETNQIIEVKVIDGIKVFENDFGIWNYIDEDLFIEV